MDELKTMIRALAISNAANGITVAQLNKDFKSLEGYAIPYSRFGFQSLDGMLRTMTDAVQVRGYGLTAVIQPLNNEKSQHVREMVKMSKPLKKKHPVYHRSPEPNFSNSFYNNRYSSHLDDDFGNGYNDEPAMTDTFYTNNNAHETNNNAQKQHVRSDKLDKDEPPEYPIQADKSVKISADTNNQREMKPVAITKPMTEDYKRVNHAIDTANTKTPIQKMNGSVCRLTSNAIVPADAMTIREKVIEDALLAHVKPNATVQVVVTSVLNPRHMFVHLLEHTDKLLKLGPYIDSIYSTKTTAYEWFIPESMVQVGLYCAAKYHDRWHRAQVMSPVNYQHALLLYIDYGYLRYVPLREIRFLTRELASIPRQTIRVALKYMKPSNGTWSKESCEQLANLVHRKAFQMHVVDVDVKENMLDVVLTDSANRSVDSFVHNSDEGSLNRQMARRDDITWSAD